uniref:Hybrid signal transduction histidine kinase M n=1 Tax=Tanacetum cinerariifolium TaxID=118510 RepID=A0A699ICH0_TANCI|nr:hybrid signal transduction histidine kinase M [Tanacetum cinerariifolium]
MSSRAQLTGRITALITENATLKARVKGKQNSGPTQPKKPKVLTPGMFAICTKYIPPPRRENWVAPTPKPRKKQVTFREPPRPSHSITQKTVMQTIKKPTIHVNLSTGVKPATRASNPMSKRDTRNHSTLLAKHEKVRRAEDHHRNLNKQNHDIWKILVDLFHHNKEARSMKFHEEIRSLEIGSLTISEYFKKIKVISDLLSNIDSPVSEKNLLIVSSHPKQGRGNARDTHSSSSVLLASSYSINKDRSNKELCRNFQRGFCRFDERWKFVHSRGSHIGRPSQWGSQNYSPAPRQCTCGSNVVSRPNLQASWAGQSSFHQAHLTKPRSSILNPASYQLVPYGHLDQPTTIPHIFNATTL